MRLVEHIFMVMLAVAGIILIGENASYWAALGVFLFTWANNIGVSKND